MIQNYSHFYNFTLCMWILIKLCYNFICISIVFNIFYRKTTGITFKVNLYILGLKDIKHKKSKIDKIISILFNFFKSISYIIILRFFKWNLDIFNCFNRRIRKTKSVLNCSKNYCHDLFCCNLFNLLLWYQIHLIL